MRGDRRRSPPRDERRFSGGGGGRGWDGGRRRQRSPSPDRFRRGSPPGKRYRRDDYDDYDRPGGRFDRGDSYGYRGRDRYDDRPPPPRGPMTFVEFVRDLPPQMGPEQAAGEYRRYLADWWGDAIKAEFEERKHEAGVRRRFDPREIARVQERRNELAQAAATSLAAEFTSGGTLADEEHAPPGPDGFTDEAAAERDRAEQEREGEPAPALAPALCWRPSQVAADLALAKQLMATVDKEKGVGENPLLPRPAAADAAADEGGEGEGAAGGSEQPAAEGEQAAAEGEQQAAAPATEQPQQQQEGGEGGSGPADMDAELSPEEQLAKLDQVLAYLWRVHGIDFYGGREFTNPAERGRAVARRTRRGPQPTAAELAVAAEKAAEAAAEGEAGEAGGAPAAEGEESGQQENGQQEKKAAGEGAGDGAAGEAEGTVAAATSPTAAAAEAKSPTAGGGALAAQQGGGAAGAGAARAAGGAEEEEREYERRVSGFWKFRIEKGDPLEGPLQRKRIEEGVEAFLEAQIIKIEDNKWGNKLSQKMFMGREFVVKHIRNKHGHVLEAERERLQEEAFWENFRAFKQEEQRRQEEEQERVMAGMAGRGPGALAAGGMLPLEGGAAVLNPAGGMVMAPILMPAAGGMAPIIMPVDAAMMMGMAAGMGGRGGRGSMRGMPVGGRGSGRGGGRGMGGPMPGAKLDAGGTVREYFDLDAPQNNRAVLDYGDL